jgi:predicted nucleic acid-binding protein
MRILLDTNIIILRENHKVIQEDLQILMRVIQKLDYKILLHPKSIEDINRDSDDYRRKITLSKFKTYNTLEIAPDPNTDLKFLDIIGSPKKDNDIVDNFLLFAVYRNAVNFLITEDLGIHKKARITKLSERVLNVIDRCFINI